MKRYPAIRRLLAVLMIAGLALAPASRPVMAEASAHAAMPAMADEMCSSDTMDQMANDMPCCPSKALAPVGCDKCACVAACMSASFAGMSAAAALHPFLAASDDIALRQNDSRPDGLGHLPPEHPPRILV